MRKNKSLLLILLLLLGLVLFACKKDGGSGDMNKEKGKNQLDKEDKDPGEITGEIIDAGRISALCPDGWISFPVKDLFSDDSDAIVSNKLEFRKGATTTEDYAKPGINISYYGENETFFEIQKDDYESPEDVTPFESGGRRWEGFKAINSGESYVWLWSGESDGDEFLINFLCQYNGIEINLQDEDLMAIISSIKNN